MIKTYKKLHIYTLYLQKFKKGRYLHTNMFDICDGEITASKAHRTAYGKREAKLHPIIIGIR